MVYRSINLSSSGLKNVTTSINPEEDEFLIIIGDQEIQLKRVFAEFISPLISHLHRTDPTNNFINFNDLYSNKMSEFKMFTKDILTSDIITLFRDMSNGFSININETQAFKLRFLSIILGNEELFSKINENFPPDYSKENIETYIDYIQCCYHFSQFAPDFDFSSLIDFISNNFYSIDEEKFLQLPRTIQYSIISNPHLQIKSEDSLLDIVIQIINSSSEKVPNNDEIESISFLEHIEFTGLTEEKLRDFLSIFDFNLITNSLWKKFYECFFIHFNSNPERIFNRHSCKQGFEYIENKTDKFDGIINYLTKKFGGNVDEKGICKITASSTNNRYVPRNAVDYVNNWVFSTMPENNSWLKIDFLNRRVSISHYSIKTWKNLRGDAHLKNWVIEGSNSDKDDEWKILDSRNNQSCLNDRWAEATFKVQNISLDNDYYRYIRIRQTGPNWYGTHQLVINSIEFFGTII